MQVINNNLKSLSENKENEDMNIAEQKNPKSPHYTLSNKNHPNGLAAGEFEGGEPIPADDDDMEDLISSEVLKIALSAPIFES